MIEKLIQRGKELGYKRIRTKEIYHFNKSSLNLFRSLGFEIIGETKSGIKMELRIA